MSGNGGCTQHDVVRGGILIRYATKLGSGLGGVLARRNLNRSSTLLIATIGVVGTIQIVFTNLIMTTHVNEIGNQPSMNLMVVGGYKNVAINPRRGYIKNQSKRRIYQEPSVVIA